MAAFGELKISSSTCQNEGAVDLRSVVHHAALAYTLVTSIQILSRHK